MSSQPTIATGRRRQHELLRSWSGWPLTSILIEPAEVAHARETGWAGTHHHDPETGVRIVGTADGLGFGVDEGWHNPVEVIPWAEVEAIARAVPEEVRQQLVEFRSRWRDHQVAYPRFVASAEAVGCGPIVPGQPLTPRQEAYVREHETFEASGVLPAWEEKRAALDAERLVLHGQALALEADSEAGDLLELLADQQLDRNAQQTGKAAAPGEGSALRPGGRRCVRLHPVRRAARRTLRRPRARSSRTWEAWTDDRKQAGPAPVPGDRRSGGPRLRARHRGRHRSRR